MLIKLIMVGKTDQRDIDHLVQHYQQRLKHYIRFEALVVADVKRGAPIAEALQKERESKLILDIIQPTDVVWLLDEKGKSWTSEGFADFLQLKMNQSTKTLVFVIGGPYGFAPALYARAQGQLSLSAMTFSHQMIRLFFVEQLYRAFTILKGEPYHHR